MPKQRGGHKRKRVEVDDDDDGEENIQEEKHVTEPSRVKKVLKSSVDLFTEPLIDTTTKRTSYETFMQQQTTMDPLIITVPGSDHYTDMTSITLEFDVEFLDAQGNKLANTALTAPVNNIGHSLIRQMKVTLNGNNVQESSEDNYFMIAYLVRLLEFGVQEKQDNLTIEGWYEDTPGRLDVLDPTPTIHADYQLGGDNAAVDDAANPTAVELNTWMTAVFAGEKAGVTTHNEGAYKRHKLCCQGRAVHFEIHPVIPLFRSQRYLPPGCELVFTIYWNRPQLVFNADQAQGTQANRSPKFRIVANTPKVKVHNVMLKEELHVELEDDMLNKKMIAKYPHMSHSLKTTTIPNGRRSHDWNNVFTGNCPNYMIVGLVRGDAYNGDYQHAFTNFQDLNQSSIRVTRNGEEIPHQRLVLDGHYREEGFKALLKFTGRGVESPPIGIRRESYKEGYYLIMYNFNSDGDQNFTHDYDKNKGTVNIRIEFSANTDHNTTIVTLGYFENQGWLDGNKNFTLKHGNI